MKVLVNRGSVQTGGAFFNKKMTEQNQMVKNYEKDPFITEPQLFVIYDFT